MTLTELLAKEKHSLPSLLPMVHATKAIAAKKILENGILTVKNCKVFKMPLSYFFYGKNSYRVDNHTGTTLPSYAPVVFVLNTPTSFHSSHVFDTGAASIGMFEAYFPGIDITEIFATASIGNSDIELKKATSALFGTNENYIREKIEKLSSLSVPPTSFSLIQLIGLMKADAWMANFDDRRRTFEIKLNTDIEIDTTTLKWLIYPKTYDDDSDFTAHLNKFPPESRITYEGRLANYPDKSHAAVTHLVEKKILEIL